MDELKQGMIDAIRNNKQYDYLAIHGHEYSKEELKDIAMELAYGLCNMTDAGRAKVAGDLTERWKEGE